MRDSRLVDEQDMLLYKVDQILSREEFVRKCRENPDGNWIMNVENDPLKEALEFLDDIQKVILKLFFVDKLNLYQISRKTGMSCEAVVDQITAMKVRLSYYVQAEPA